ncbi:MAG: hypothetical protein JSS50_00200 [Proteobacteria bacterium]|nr:hypothetical protein [Pseudomonadota bacterium]
MSKKHPGTPQRNEYLQGFIPETHKAQENEPPHHDWHELENLLVNRAPPKKKAAKVGAKPAKGQATARKTRSSRKQPVL